MQLSHMEGGKTAKAAGKQRQKFGPDSATAAPRGPLPVIEYPGLCTSSPNDGQTVHLNR
jgi:hypothetical protein